MGEALRDRIRGCLVGAVLGDCLGAPVECRHWEGIPTHQVDKQFEKYFSDNPSKVYKYTDDTAMARQVAQSLIDGQGELKNQDLALRFHQEYYNEPWRGYGGSVVEVFSKLSNQGENDDCFKPAQEQFDGSGSYGNGAAMRVHPVAIMASNMQEVVDLASRQSRLTHSHPDAVDGAVLQATAVHLALKTHRSSQQQFIDALKENIPDTSSYDLSTIQELLGLGDQLKNSEMIQSLGNDVSASRSVPPAIFSFIREAFDNRPSSSGSQFLRVLKTALRFGGDSDTIGSMAGAIAGARFGISSIPKELMRICEGVDHAEQQADKMFDLIKADE